jgi:histidine triad (HIT) family protein
MEKCIFCEILEGKIPSFKIAEDQRCLAILDKYPCIKGQVLVISKKHHPPGFSQMGEQVAVDLVSFAKKISGKICQALNLLEVTFAIEGLDVKHAHGKMFPVKSREEYVREIKLPGQPAEDKELEAIAYKIRGEGS